MFFRNPTLFRIVPGHLLPPQDLDAALSMHPARPCGPLELHTTGFAAPSGIEGDPFAFDVGTNWALVTVAHDTKILPASAVNAALKAKLDAYAKETGKPASGKRRREMKTEVIDTLLPRALTAPSRTNVYLDNRNGWIVIDTGSRREAEDALTMLRQALGSLPAVPITTNGIVPGVVMTDWLAHPEHLPQDLGFGSECALKDPASGATVRCGKQELEADDVRAHVQHGMHCEKLGLEYNGHVGFVLKEDLSLSKIRLFDGVLDQLDGDFEGQEAELEARMALFTGELEQLLAAMSKWFGIVAPRGDGT